MKITDIIVSIGKFFWHTIYLMGYSAEALIINLVKIVSPPYYFKRLLSRIIEIGFYSLPVVALTSIFSGMVLALQSYTSFGNLPSESIIANVVVISLTRELAPVLTCLMVAGRMSSSISAEIGTMKVTEQLGALFTLSTNRIKFLVAPSVVAGFLCLPILVFISDVLGVMGGFLVATFKLGFNPTSYVINSYNAATFYDIFSGLVKGASFGVILTSIACYFGFRTDNGASGVGKSTTYAVVVASIFIFVCDYILTLAFFGVR